MDRSVLDKAFFQARLKVYRADKHIDEAQRLFAAYVETDFCDVIDDTDPETGDQIIRMEVAHIPSHIVLAIGDAFHCMSAALDYVASGLMRARTGDASRIHFPSHECRKGLRKSFMPPKPGKAIPPNRRIMEAFPLIAFGILTIIKPYKGGDFGIWEIRKADNIDKHNLIIPSVAVSELRDAVFVDEARNVRASNNVYTVGAGGRLNLVEYPNRGARLKLEQKGKASASIRFADDMEVFQGRPVFPTLLECSQLTSEALDRIEAVAKTYF